MRLVECINDSGYKEHSLKYIESFPVKGETYIVRSKVVFNGETGYLLEEITNPLMPNGYEPNFHVSRFKDVHDDLDLKLLLTETKELIDDYI